MKDIFGYRVSEGVGWLSLATQDSGSSRMDGCYKIPVRTTRAGDGVWHGPEEWDGVSLA